MAEPAMEIAASRTMTEASQPKPRLRVVAPQPAKRFFSLRGFMKSGTNWVCNLLNLHPQIHCVGECHWEHLLRPLDEHPLAGSLANRPEHRSMLQREVERVIRRMMCQMARPDAELVGDRTPHTIEPLVLGDAPTICIVRDGRDVLVSRIFHIFNRPKITKAFDRYRDLARRLKRFQADPWYFHKHPHELLANEYLVRLSARWWANHLRADRESCQRRCDLRVLLLRYEALHDDVQTYRRQMYEFLDVDPDLAEPLDARCEAGGFKEKPNAFYRKGHVGDWKNYFTDDAREWFKDEAGEELIRSGFATDADW